MDNINRNSYLANRQKFIKKHLIVKPKIIIDAVCFQFDDLEVNKIWRSLLDYWSNTDFAKNLVILDRGNTAEKIEGIRYRNITHYDAHKREEDRQMLQFICDEEEADLLVSTFFTTALKTTSILLINDLFPEVKKADFKHPLLQARIEAIEKANHYILTTNSIAQDFQKIYQIRDNDISVIYGGIDENYYVPEVKTVSEFKYRYGIHKPYFLLPNLDYRYNIELFLKAFSQLPSKTAFDLLLPNTQKIPPEWRQYTEGCTWHLLNLPDSEIKLAYHGAIALIHFSYHDGFSSYILEAMACGCPIIAFKNPSVEEIAGEAIIFVDNQDLNSIFNAFCQVQGPIIRQNLIQTGLKQVSQFSWQKTGEIIKAVLLDLIIDVKLSEINYIIFPDWQTEEEVLGEELTLILEKLITTSNDEEITLLIDTTNISEEEANLFISGVTMNLLWNTEKEIPDNIHLSILPKLNLNQWQKILPQVLAKISMDQENSDIFTQIESDFLPTISYKYDNYFLNPDWTVKEEILIEELFNTINQLANQLTEDKQVFLIINVEDIDLEKVKLLVSDIAFNLLLENEIDISEKFYISCIQNLTSQQWQHLSKLTNKIDLVNENKNLFNTPSSSESLATNSYHTINLPLKIAQEIWQDNLQSYIKDNLTILQEEYQGINLDLFTAIPANANSILEFGCGCGLYGERYKLINPHCQYIGVESNQEKIANAQSRLDQVIQSNFSNFSPHDFGIDAKAIDCLIYNNKLEYSSNPQEIITQHLELLKDEGYVIICVDNQQHWTRILNLFNHSQTNSDTAIRLPNYNFSQIEKILINSGLKITKAIPSKNILPPKKFLEDSQFILNTFNIDTKEFEDIVTHLQYIIVAEKQSQQISKPLLIHTRISNTICRLMRVEYPHYCLQTNPYIHLKEEANNDFQPVNFEGDKIFIWQRPFLDYPIELEVALEKQKQLIDAGYITIMELDDDPSAWFEETREQFYILAKLCHGIQTSTGKLAESMKKIHHQVACFPNQMPYIFPYEKTFSDETITLLFAAQNREADWQVIINPLNEIINEYYEKINIKVIYDQKFYEALKTDKKEFENWCSYLRYQEILKSCDIHLIPLEYNQFNSMKSDLKFIESSAYGVISLAGSTVYEESIIDGETGMIYHSPEEFKEKLMMLINNRSLRENISINAYNYVKNNRLLSQHYQERMIWYQQIVNNVNYSDKNAEYSYKYTDKIENEANRQEELNNKVLTYILRDHIKKIEPKQVNNLLKLILLKLDLNILQSEEVKQWNIASLLRDCKSRNDQEIDKNLLLLATDKLLDLPWEENLDFADAVYSYFDGDKNINELFLSKLLTIGQERTYYYYNYGAKLGEICLSNHTENLEVVNELINFYNYLGELDKVKVILQNLYKSAKTTAEKSVILSQYCSHLITVGEWQEVVKIIPEFKKILLNLIEEQPDIQKPYLRNGLSKITQPLLYFDDQPREKRLLINGVGQLFQKIAHQYYSCPVHFLSSRKKDLSRKLKIGYIGRTMRSHAVGLLCRWLIHHHDREKFDIYTYFVCHQVEDKITQEFFRKNVIKAHNSTNVINDLITEIEKDEIDILIDLDSFTENMTSLIMALKPAPIQVSWLGLDSNGIPAIDYFIVDPYVLPDHAQEYYSEKIWRLPNIYLGVDGVEIGTPTLTRNDLGIPEDAVVYLSLQTGLKRHPDNIRLQMKILANVPNSYFLVSGDKTEIAKNNISKLFATIALEEGVNPERIIVLPFMPLQNYRANLTLGDIVLDTYPFNGATTTIDTLWLNIPLVTRVGEQYHARQGYTLLRNLGISEGIAWSDEEYIEWGIKLGTDENLRKEISWKLKQSKKTSPLWNGKQFAREMEKAYQKMWEIYVKENSGSL